jgi:hypothetical protein
MQRKQINYIKRFWSLKTQAKYFRTNNSSSTKMQIIFCGVNLEELANEILVEINNSNIQNLLISTCGAFQTKR